MPTPADTNTNNINDDRHLVLGAGAIGSRLATELARAGSTVCVVTRSGSGPDHPNIERIAADVGDRPRLAELAEGCTTVFNCGNPPYPKWAEQWPPMTDSIIAACAHSGSRLVTLSNLYGYAADSSPMRATDELAPPTRKGAIRVATWRAALDAHEAGRITMTEVRASDFIGPGVGANGHVGDRFVPRLLSGKGVSVLGRPDVEHSWSYVADVVVTLIAVARDDRALGRRAARCPGENGRAVGLHPPVGARRRGAARQRRHRSGGAPGAVELARRWLPRRSAHRGVGRQRCHDGAGQRRLPT